MFATSKLGRALEDYVQKFVPEGCGGFSHLLTRPDVPMVFRNEEVRTFASLSSSSKEGLVDFLKSYKAEFRGEIYPPYVQDAIIKFFDSRQHMEHITDSKEMS